MRSIRASTFFDFSALEFDRTRLDQKKMDALVSQLGWRVFYESIKDYLPIPDNYVNRVFHSLTQKHI